AAPCVLGSGIAVVDADEIDGLEVEVEAARVLDPATEDQVQLAHRAPPLIVQPWLRTAATAASAEALAASVRPSSRLRIVASPFSLLIPSSSRRCDPVSRAASSAALAVFLTRLAVGLTSLVSASVRGSRAAISAPAAIPPASASSGAWPSVSLARPRASP